MKFALITEGPSENRIIKHIIQKVFRDYDPLVNQIQPRLLVSGKQDATTPGGWNEVLKYCERPELGDILIENDYLIIQIDTDMSENLSFGIKHTGEDGNPKTVETLYHDVYEKLKALIPSKIATEYENKIFFAICIHSIECWLLPIYYTDKKKAAKTQKCLDQLNLALEKKEIHKITSSNKNEVNGVRAYEAVLKEWKKSADISKAAKHNFGFEQFINSLNSINL